jgi:hypothetical protein
MIIFPSPSPGFSPGLGGGGWFVLRMRRPLAPPSLGPYPDLGIIFLARAVGPVLNQSKVLGQSWVELEHLLGQACCS